MVQSSVLLEKGEKHFGSLIYPVKIKSIFEAFCLTWIYCLMKLVKHQPCDAQSSYTHLFFSGQPRLKEYMSCSDVTRMYNSCGTIKTKEKTKHKLNPTFLKTGKQRIFPEGAKTFPIHTPHSPPTTYYFDWCHMGTTSGILCRVCATSAELDDERECLHVSCSIVLSE